MHSAACQTACPQPRQAEPPFGRNSAARQNTATVHPAVNEATQPAQMRASCLMNDELALLVPLGCAGAGELLHTSVECMRSAPMPGSCTAPADGQDRRTPAQSTTAHGQKCMPCQRRTRCALCPASTSFMQSPSARLAKRSSTPVRLVETSNCDGEMAWGHDTSHQRIAAAVQDLAVVLVSRAGAVALRASAVSARRQCNHVLARDPVPHGINVSIVLVSVMHMRRGQTFCTRRRTPPVQSRARAPRRSPAPQVAQTGLPTINPNQQTQSHPPSRVRGTVLTSSALKGRGRAPNSAASLPSSSSSRCMSTVATCACGGGGAMVTAARACGGRRSPIGSGRPASSVRSMLSRSWALCSLRPRCCCCTSSWNRDTSPGIPSPSTGASGFSGATYDLPGIGSVEKGTVGSGVRGSTLMHVCGVKRHARPAPGRHRERARDVRPRGAVQRCMWRLLW